MKNATLLAIIGIIMILLSRIVGMLSPVLYAILPLSAGNWCYHVVDHFIISGTIILGTVLILVFFIVLYKRQK